MPWAAAGAADRASAAAPRATRIAYLKASLEHAISTTVPAKTNAKLKAAAENHMDRLAKSPDVVRACFRDPWCEYAA